MISDEALGRVCSPAVLSRGHFVADRGIRIHDRECSYVGSKTVLYAQVDGTYSYNDVYETSVTIDEDADRVLDYACTCPAARSYAGACKHAVALVLDFNDRGRRYAGFDASSHVATSPSVARYLDRARQRVTQASGNVTDDMGGSISLELTLSYAAGQFSARFRVLGTRGGYVLKSISDFVQDVEAGAYRKYGQKLAFTHSRDMFSLESRPVVDFLVRAIRQRRAFSYDSLNRGGYFGGHSMSARSLRLSAPELEDLLDLNQGGSFLFEDDLEAGQQKPAKPREVRLVDGDPDVGMELVELGGGSFELARQGRLHFHNSYGTLYAWDAGSFYRCSSKFGPVADFLTTVYDDPAEHILLSSRDIRAFCVTTLPALERAVSVSVPPKLDELRPEPCRLRFYLDRGEGSVTCRAIAAYGDEEIPLMDRRRATERDLERDRSMEALGREVASRYFSVVNGDRLVVPEKDVEAVARLVYEGMAELRRIGEVFATEAFSSLRATSRPSVSVGLSVRSSLVDVSVTTSDLAPEDLYALLDSYRLRRRYHRLRDGSILELEGLDLDEVATVVEELGISAAELAAGHATIPSYKAFLLDTIVDDGQKDASFERYIEGFRSVDPTVYLPPASLADVLRPYQVEGYQWLSSLIDMGFGGILADEMGLGKSVQLISLLLARRQEARQVGPSLIVCPASLVYNWQAEFAKFAPELDVLVVAGTAQERRRLRREGSPDVMVTSYDLLRRDVEDYAAMSFWCEVLDEAQYIKNHETLAARAVKVVQARHHVALTGTPIENRLSELWSIFDFLMPGLLGSYERFRDRYERPIIEVEDDETRSRLRAAVHPFILRRLKRDVLLDLPDKLEQVVYAQMEPEQRDLYAAHVLQLRDSLGSQSDASFSTGKLQVLAALTRLRQICCDPRLVFEDYDGSSAKMDAIMDLVEQAVDAQQKMLVFSQFTSYLDLIAAELDRRGFGYLTITGATPKRRRVELVDQFNADDTPVFLISLKAGGTGLNLTGASIVLHADPWWNAAAQNQATDRAHRIGQTQDVTVYKVIAKDTLEEKILDLQETKSQLADAVVGETGEAGLSLARLTRSDLIELLQ